MKRSLWMGSAGLALLLAAAIAVIAAQAAPASQTFVVDTTFDGVDNALGDGQCNDGVGRCTLRAAIQEANVQANIHNGGVYTILLQTPNPVNIFGLNITGSGEDQAATGDLDVLCNLTIKPQGPGAAVIDGGGANDRVFDVLTSIGHVDALTLISITLQHGSADFGGGIRASTALTLINSAVVSNTVSGLLAEGGGIYTDGPLVLNHSIVRGNAALGNGSSLTYQGGGIWALSTLYIADSLVSNNRLIGSGTGDKAEGGGIYLSGYLSLTNSLLSGNIVSATTGLGMGGGLYTDGPFPTALLFSDTVSGNSASSYGGGIFAFHGLTSLARSTVGNNRVDGVGLGGGLFVMSGTLALRDSIVSSNTATDGAGAFVDPHAGVLDVARSLFSLNATPVSGGGINNGGLLTLTNSTLFLNTSQQGGAGLYNEGVATLSSDTFLANIAQFNNVFSGDGGGIYNANAGVVYLRNTVLDNINSGGEAPDCKGTIILMDYNLIHSTAGCTLANNINQHNLTGVASGLAFLLDHGGPTLTSAPAANSPLIEGGNPGGCVDADGTPLLTDQRGYPRTADSDHNGTARCDIGAYETELNLYLPLIRR